MSISKVTATFQKKVLVNVMNNDGSGFYRTFSFEQFFEWLDDEAIQNFSFRPANHDQPDLIQSRTKQVENAGFIVKESEDKQHYLYAYR